jgi:hypothetical protein
MELHITDTKFIAQCRNSTHPSQYSPQNNKNFHGWKSILLHKFNLSCSAYPINYESGTHTIRVARVVVVRIAIAVDIGKVRRVRNAAKPPVELIYRMFPLI